MKNIDELVRPNIRNLTPYSTARDEYKGSIGTFLDANESPYPTGWNRYPDPRQEALKEKVAQLRGVRPGNIFFGNGSDEAIDLIFRIFCNPGKDNAVVIRPSYGMYSVSAHINDVELREVQLREDFSLPTDEILGACDNCTKVIFLCSPNNPSGNAIPNEEIFTLLNEFGGMVIVDEAYIDFSSVPSLLGHLDRFPNLIVLQTFSKAFGLASLRLGMAFSQEKAIRLMSMVKYPYNINGSTQKLALQALESPVRDQVDEIIAERGRVAYEFGKISVIRKIYPSDANFILVKVDDADSLYEHLLADGVIVRNRTRVPGCEGCLRITIGLRAENDRMLESLKKWSA